MVLGKVLLIALLMFGSKKLHSLGSDLDASMKDFQGTIVKGTSRNRGSRAARGEARSAERTDTRPALGFSAQHGAEPKRAAHFSNTQVFEQ